MSSKIMTPVKIHKSAKKGFEQLPPGALRISPLEDVNNYNLRFIGFFFRSIYYPDSNLISA